MSRRAKICSIDNFIRESYTSFAGEITNERS